MDMVSALRPDPDHRHVETRWQQASLWEALNDLRKAFAVLDEADCPGENQPDFASIESSIRINEEHLKMIVAAWEREDRLRQAVLSLREKKERLRVLQLRLEEIRRQK
ncbi:MAG: hypothetical protein V4671_09635 [Armatimonadota bacterium]